MQKLENKLNKWKETINNDERLLKDRSKNIEILKKDKHWNKKSIKFDDKKYSKDRIKRVQTVRTYKKDRK